MSPQAVSTLPLLALLGVWLYAIWDFTHTAESKMRTYPRRTWVVYLALFSFVGALMWFRLGRPRRR